MKKINKINTWQGREEGTKVWSFEEHPKDGDWSAPRPGFWTELHENVACNMAERVREHLQDRSRGVSEQTDFAGLSPLHYAKSRTIAKLLLEAGAPITAKGNDKFTPLHSAAKTGQKDLVALLIEHGCELNPRDNHSRTPLHWAAHEGHYRVIQVLLGKGADPLLASEYGRNPLHMAASRGYLRAVETLVEGGKVDINILDSDGRTALHLAVAGNHGRVISYLSDLGKSWPEDRSGFTAIHLAAFLGHVGAFKAFLRNDQKARRRSEQDANQKVGHEVEHEREGAQKLLEKVDRISNLSTSGKGATALHLAARYDKISVIKFILTLKPAPPIDKPDNAGRTPLMFAALHGNNAAVKLLLQNGSKVDARNNIARSALHLATTSEGSSASDVIKSLLDEGANSKLKDKKGFTPLLYATATRNYTAVKALIPASDIMQWIIRGKLFCISLLLYTLLLQTLLLRPLLLMMLLLQSLLLQTLLCRRV